MITEVTCLLMCALLGFAAVLIFRPESYWSRMVVGALMGLFVWVVRVITIWWDYHG